MEVKGSLIKDCQYWGDNENWKAMVSKEIKEIWYLPGKEEKAISGILCLKKAAGMVKLLYSISKRKSNWKIIGQKPK